METITIDLKRGETIFKNIVEYPLDKKEGVKDYIFYAVPFGDPYGKGARIFLNKYYKNHGKKKVNSLEEIIDHLHSEIENKNIDQIREIVIVAHGNIRDLLFPVTKNASDNDEKYRIIRAGTIVNLQKAFKDDDPDLIDFKKKREEVIKKLLDTSWVTIRACKFGKSIDGLFALYSFFGGRSHVYAPVKYQMFVHDMPIGNNYRIKSRLDFYQHLVKQGYIKRKAKHSAKRKAKIVKALIEPGRGKQSFALSGYELKDNMAVSGDKIVHDSFISSLNQKKMPDAIKDLFFGQRLLLSKKIIINRIKKNKKWVVYDDKLKIKGVEYKILYKIKIEYKHFSDEENYEESLSVYPILDHESGKEKVPLQLFFDNEEHEKYKGEFFKLSTYSIFDNVVDDKQEKDRYDAFVKLLDKEELEDGNGNNIITAFEDEINFEDEDAGLINPIIKKLPTIRGKKQWEIQDKSTFKIKEVHSYIYPKGDEISLVVFRESTKDFTYNFLSSNGSDPDTPGTELMAYLDSFSKEELLDLIHFLRKPYKEEHAFYIYMVQEALERKPDYMQWYVTTDIYKKALDDPLDQIPGIYLQDGEHGHKNKYAYAFNNVWQHIKGFRFTTEARFKIDLFEERELPFPSVLIKEEPPGPDSPSIDPSLPGGVPGPPSDFYDDKKTTFSEEVIMEDISCEKFGEALEIIKQNKGKSWDEIEQILKEAEVDEDTSFYNYMTSNYGYESFSLAIELLGNFSPYAVSPYASSTVTLASRLGNLAISRTIFFTSTALTIVGPLLMLKASLLDPTLKGKEKFKRAGTVTGLKQGIKMINEIPFDYIYRDIPISDRYNLFDDAPDHEKAHFSIYKTPLHGLPSWRDSYRDGYKLGIEEVNEYLNEGLRKHMKIFKQYVQEEGMKECHFKKLLNSGLIDKDGVKLAILSSLKDQIREITRSYILDIEN